jgi:AcrR family transcriptional regulator
LILDAAVDELGIGRAAGFSIERVAARAGVEPSAVQQWWPNSPALLSEAVAFHTARCAPTAPDTGTLYGDLLEFAMAYAAQVGTPIGRRVLDAMIVRPGDWDVMGVREAYLQARRDFAGAMVQRGVARRECSPDTDPGHMIETLTLAVCLPVLIYDRPITADDCRNAVEMVMHGIGASR